MRCHCLHSFISKFLLKFTQITLFIPHCISPSDYVLQGAHKNEHHARKGTKPPSALEAGSNSLRGAALRHGQLLSIQASVHTIAIKLGCSGKAHLD